MRRKICIVTGTRAEYGLLRPLLQILKNDPDCELQLIVTGSHLSLKHGMTISEIENDGFVPNAKIFIDLDDDSKLGVIKSMASATNQLAQAVSQLAPEVIVLLGDRFEILAASQAALILGIPVAHIHGGELTTGAFDDSIRHAVTKMSNLHFVAAPEYARRVAQLGEQPGSIFEVGSLGVQAALQNEPVSTQDLEQSLGIELKHPILLVTYHPTTRGGANSATEIDEVLAALTRFVNCTIVFTGTNSDPGNFEITAKIRDFVESEPKKRTLCVSLGQKKYLSLLSLCDVVVGNSSSGIIEAPAFGKPTVNIGSRQDGRLRAESIIDVAAAGPSIQTAIETAMSPLWRERCATVASRYASMNTAERIAEILKNVDLTIEKRFVDL